MRTRFAAAALAIAMAAGFAKPALPAAPSPVPKRAARVIAAGRHVDVHLLDSSLASQSLDAWLARRVGRRASIAWEANDCGERTADPAGAPADFPVCAEATIRFRDGRKAGISLAVGTYRKGVRGRPVIWHMYAEEAGAPPGPPRKLSELGGRLSARSGGEGAR